ncbi:hypothetical protein [Candidatus Vondammii sp. HM_W22]|uniref:hypothetical protein n=1 Tax=Candidatus Vondammii sp. HM_W22 TaxID=2687299 RepID=UPI001F13088A|nr:hypothetical protein [Candidatus Vondammii sp. HM_W22]
MNGALASSRLCESDIDYVNLHGTATPMNDISEDQGLMKVFTSRPTCSSTKGFTGHTLGAAGIVDAVLSCIAITDHYVPPNLNTHDLDERIQANILLQGKEQKLEYVMSNSFGFGGSNASLIFGAA